MSVRALGKRKLYLVDPQGGSLSVQADGGPGGSGGRGGRGGRDGSNGLDGRSGFDGQPGKGGSIKVTFDPQAPPYLSAIHLSSRYGPAPVFNTCPVAPLWWRPYSYRNTTTGSTLIARRAGTAQASNAMVPSTAMTLASTSGSKGRVP